MSGIAVELKNISVNYGANPVLHDFSLAVEAGELVALLGASGCGKTTALKAVAGLLPVSDGEIWLAGENITEKAAEKRETALVFQKPLLFPFLNVENNVGFGLKMRRTPTAVIKAKVAEALRLVQLAGFEARRPKQLSGGQEQRVALARALVTNPRVLLLDEPFSALDAKLRDEMQNLVRELQKNLGITTLFVTHDQSEAVAVANRIAFVHNGGVEQFGAPEDFFTVPKTAVAAEFFGWKVLRGTIINNRVETDCGVLNLPRGAIKIEQNQSVKIAFHPASVEFALVDAGTDNNCLSGILIAKTPLGARLRYAIRLKNGELIDGETNVPEAINYLQTIQLRAVVILKIPASRLMFYSNSTAA